MTMPGGHGEMGDPHQQPNCGLQIEPPPPLDEGAYHHQTGNGQLMSKVRCNIIGKPPPPLPHMGARVSAESTSILANSSAQQQMQRYCNQW